MVSAIKYLHIYINFTNEAKICDARISACKIAAILKSRIKSMHKQK